MDRETDRRAHEANLSFATFVKHDREPIEVRNPTQEAGEIAEEALQVAVGRDGVRDVEQDAVKIALRTGAPVGAPHGRRIASKHQPAVCLCSWTSRSKPLPSDGRGIQPGLSGVYPA